MLKNAVVEGREKALYEATLAQVWRSNSELKYEEVGSPHDSYVLKILRDAHTNNIRCLVIVTYEGEEQQECVSNHFVHPMSEISEQGSLSVALWVQEFLWEAKKLDTQTYRKAFPPNAPPRPVPVKLRLRFKAAEDKHQFIEEYEKYKDEMARIHDDTKEVWSVVIPASQGQSSQVAAAEPSRLTSTTPSAQPVVQTIAPEPSKPITAAPSIFTPAPSIFGAVAKPTPGKPTDGAASGKPAEVTPPVVQTIAREPSKPVTAAPSMVTPAPSIFGAVAKLTPGNPTDGAASAKPVEVKIEAPKPLFGFEAKPSQTFVPTAPIAPVAQQGKAVKEPPNETKPVSSTEPLKETKPAFSGFSFNTTAVSTPEKPTQGWTSSASLFGGSGTSGVFGGSGSSLFGGAAVPPKAEAVKSELAKTVPAAPPKVVEMLKPQDSTLEPSKVSELPKSEPNDIISTPAVEQKAKPETAKVAPQSAGIDAFASPASAKTEEKLSWQTPQSFSNAPDLINKATDPGSRFSFTSGLAASLESDVATPDEKKENGTSNSQLESTSTRSPTVNADAQGSGGSQEPIPVLASMMRRLSESTPGKPTFPNQANEEKQVFTFPASPQLKPKQFSPPQKVVSPPASANSQSFEVLLRRFYEKYNPTKVDEVPKLLEKYQGREHDVFTRLKTKYPESANDEEFSDAAFSLPQTAATQPSTAPTPSFSLSQSAPLATPIAATPSDSLESNLMRFYAKYKPEKLDEIPKLVEKYKGREPEVFERLKSKYPESANDKEFDFPVSSSATPAKLSFGNATPFTPQNPPQFGTGMFSAPAATSQSSFGTPSFGVAGGIQFGRPTILQPDSLASRLGVSTSSMPQSFGVVSTPTFGAGGFVSAGFGNLASGGGSSGFAGLAASGSGGFASIAQNNEKSGFGTSS